MLTALLLSLCVTADTARTGKYDLEITTESGTMTGQLVVKRETDELSAALTVGGRAPAVKSFKHEAQQYVLTVGHENFVIVYKLAFTRDSVAGSFNGSGGMSGTVVGAIKR